MTLRKKIYKFLHKKEDLLQQQIKELKEQNKTLQETVSYNNAINKYNITTNNNVDITTKNNKLESAKNIYQEMNDMIKKQENINLAKDENNHEVINCSNINIRREHLTKLYRDPYNIDNHGNPLMVLSYLSSSEPLIPCNEPGFDYFLALFIQNESFARKIIELQINKIFSSAIIKNISLTEQEYNNINNIVNNVWSSILHIIFISEVYGGCFAYIDNNDIKFALSNDLLLENNDVDEFNFSKKHKLVNILQKTTIDAVDKKWLLKNRLLTIRFRNTDKIMYENIAMFHSIHMPDHYLFQNMLEGFGYSCFQGNLHHLKEILEDLESMHKQIQTQNKVLLKVPNLQNIQQTGSETANKKIYETISNITNIRNNDVLTVDSECEGQVLATSLSTEQILDGAIYKLISFLYGINYNELTGINTNKYVNQEQASEYQKQQQALTNKFALTYMKPIKKLLTRYIHIQLNIDTNAINKGIHFSV